MKKEIEEESIGERNQVGSTKRGDFRRKHHYFPYLKYWEVYEHKFDYLDNKSQGLFAISGVLSAVFLIQLTFVANEAWQQNLEGLTRILCFVASSFGLFCLIVAQFVLLGCLSTTADSNFPTHSAEAANIESRVKAWSSNESRDRNRVLESNLDTFLSVHRAMIQKIGADHRDQESDLKRIWNEIRRSEHDDFKDFERSLSDFLGKLRDAIEAEVDRRHSAYARGRLWVENSLYSLTFSVISFLFVIILERT